MPENHRFLTVIKNVKPINNLTEPYKYEYTIISGKSKKEIERMLNEGKELSNEEIVRILREVGLYPTKLK